MSRDPRKVSRTLEDRNIIGSMTRVAQIAQADNELKQKLESIDQFYKLSNKRINNETRELKQILHGLQHELRVSKADPQYVPSLYEMPSIRSRRKTVSSVPSEDRKQNTIERDLWRNTLHRPSHDNVKDRRRSTSYPSVCRHGQEVKKQTEIYDEDGGVDFLVRAEDFQHSGLNQARDVVKEIEGQRKTSQVIHRSFDTRKNGTGMCAQHEAELLWHGHDNRLISHMDCKLKLPEKGFPNDQHLTGRRKRSTIDCESHFADIVRGTFTASRETPYENDAVVSQPKNPPGRFLQANLNVSRQSRGNVAEKNRLTPYLCSQKKTSLGISQKLGQRKGTQSPATNTQLRIQEEHDFDSPPEQFRRMKGVGVHGRVRRSSRVSGLPPLKEERLTPRQEKEKPFESWSELAQCRYLRKEVKELGIDDIFGKK